MEKQYTVCLWPGAGYVLHAFEVMAFSSDEALEKAVKKALENNYKILGFYSNKHEIKEICYYYKEETKKYDNNYDFITQYLNYLLIDELNYFIHMDNTKIEEGWNLYDNSIKEEEK